VEAELQIKAMQVETVEPLDNMVVPVAAQVEPVLLVVQVSFALVAQV
jgi:hypothetical protein